ncbi:hypothetical protein HanXRQr2_Chr01g0023551 [Helianthus annuus]|uniref:Uncharacterized protein n=1 Tax=Helianthus annuus TaxID=4232 RepID=A0A9K3P3K5_HELAN|nr:hypothetical protein HanXRQr2_Chr01g0023551 [Helianthus annuus]
MSQGRGRGKFRQEKKEENMSRTHAKTSQTIMMATIKQGDTLETKTNLQGT